MGDTFVGMLEFNLFGFPYVSMPVTPVTPYFFIRLKWKERKRKMNIKIDKPIARLSNVNSYTFFGDSYRRLE